jgi:hypothetical protein
MRSSAPRDQPRDELRLDRGGGPEGSIVEGGKILRDRPVGAGIKLIGRFDTALTMRIRYDHAGIDGKALAADQTFSHAASNHRLEQLAQKVGIAEPAVARLGKVEWSGTSPSRPRRQNQR